MSERDTRPAVGRRDVLRSGAILGGGLLASALTETAAATDDANTDSEKRIAYIGQSSYRKVTGADDVDCVPGRAGWGGTVYVKRVAEDDDGQVGVSISVPTADGTDRQCDAYTVTADEEVALSGGPNGRGPWGENCGSWVFVSDQESLKTGATYRIAEVHGPALPEARQEGIPATDADGDEFGAPIELLCVSLELVPPAQQWTQMTKLAAGGADADFGTATAIDGTTAVVGATGEGAAYVYERSDDGWTQQATLGGDLGGRDVAISDETILVDAPDGDTQSVGVFTRSAGSWQRQATLEPENADASGEFASAVDIDGDTAVVGAPGADGTDSDSTGTVSVFTRSDETWSRQATLEDTRPDATDSADGLGYAVAIDGDTVVAGAPYTNHDAIGYASTGAAVVFSRSENSWSHAGFLRSEDPDNRDNQGRAVAIADDTVVVATEYAHKPGLAGDDAGAAWVYTRDESTWDQQAKLTPDNWAGRNWFGYSVSLAGDRLLVSADIFDGFGNDAQGSVYLFTRVEDQWHQLVELTADDGDAYDKFGYDVALSDDTAFVGAANDADPSGADSGSAYVFQG